MSTYIRKLPAPRDGSTWTYWISRDSLNDELSGTCSLWRVKPIRVKHRHRVTWVAADVRDPGALGEFRPDEVHAWFGAYPDTDLELVRVG